MSDLINEDSMGIFTEAQREFTEQVDEPIVTAEVKQLSAPWYTADWEIFDRLSTEQIAAWNDIQTLGELAGISGDEIKTQLIARQLASDMIAAFKQMVLLAVTERDKQEKREKRER